jgi:hypothetical protein
MTLTNTTIETINYTKDLDIEYNIKLIIFGALFLYSCVALFAAHKWEADELYKKIIKIFIMQIPPSMFLFFFPLFSIYLFRTVSWEVIYGFMIALFSYFMIVFLLAGKLGLFTMLANLLGIETKVKKMEMKTK